MGSGFSPRRSLRLHDFDYAQPGAYFVTVCTHNRQNLLGEIHGSEMVLSDAGQIVEAVWKELPHRFSLLDQNAFVVMPNHIHGIIVVGAQFIAPTGYQGAINRAPTVGQVVRSFKARSARLIRQAGHDRFAWQRNYYDHIVRDERSLSAICEYILTNPARWETDPENALCVSAVKGNQT